MAGLDLILEEQLLRILRQIQQSQSIGYGGAALGHSLGDVSLGHAIALHEATVAVGLLDGFEVGTLEVLDESEFQRLHVVSILDGDRHGLEVEQLACLPPPLACDDLVLPLANASHQA